MTLNGEMAVIVRYPTNLAVMSSFVFLLVLALSGIGLGLCLDLYGLFNNVWSCIMLLVTKLHKNLIHHENTIA